MHGDTIPGVLRNNRVGEHGLAGCRSLAVALIVGALTTFVAAQVDLTTERLQSAAKLIRKGELSQAEAQLNLIFKREPYEANALNLLGVIRAQQRRHREAEALFLRAITVNKSLLGAYLNVGQLYLDTKNFDRALWAFTEAEKLHTAKYGDTPSFQILFNLGVTWYEKGERRRAEQFFTAALALEPDDVPTLRALASIARADRELEKALSFLVRARKIAPESPEVLYDFGWSALNLNLLYDALSALAQLHRMKISDRRYLYPLAIARLNNGQADAAQTLINEYIQFRPQDGRGYYVLGAILYAGKKFAEARTAFLRSLSLLSYPDTEYYLGMIAHHQGNAQEAISRFRRALQSNPTNAAIHVALGTELSGQRDYEAARVELERAIELDPQDQTAHYQLGLVYGRLGKKDRSQSAFARSEKLRTEQKERQGLGIRLIELPK
jgi:tetratricopeptide (TPR) repeat protein